jgi:hypothetical protein
MTDALMKLRIIERNQYGRHARYVLRFSFNPVIYS